MTKLLDLAKKKSEPKEVADYFRDHSFDVFLWPDAWKSAQSDHALQWHKVEFGRSTIDAVPEIRGVYAFSISIRETIMPEHGILVYIGETSRTLRQRYREYVRDSIRGAKRTKLEYLFERWSSDLEFFFAPIADEDCNLKQIEMTLNDAVIPLCVTDDFSAEIRRLVPVLRG